MAVRTGKEEHRVEAEKASKVSEELCATMKLQQLTPSCPTVENPSSAMSLYAREKSQPAFQRGS